jgi:hypothetical protein
MPPDHQRHTASVFIAQIQQIQHEFIKVIQTAVAIIPGRQQYQRIQ